MSAHNQEWLPSPEAFPRIEKPFDLSLETTQNVVSLLNVLTDRETPTRSEVTYSFPLSLLPDDFSCPWSIARHVPPSEAISTSITYVTENDHHQTVSLNVEGDKFSILASSHADEPFHDVEALIISDDDGDEKKATLKAWDLDQWQSSIIDHYGGHVIGEDAVEYFDHTNAIRTISQEFALQDGRVGRYYEESIYGQKTEVSFSITYETETPSRRIRFNYTNSSQTFEIIDSEKQDFSSSANGDAAVFGPEGQSVTPFSADEDDIRRLNEILEEEIRAIQLKRVTEYVVDDMAVYDDALPASEDDYFGDVEHNFTD